MVSINNKNPAAGLGCNHETPSAKTHSKEATEAYNFFMTNLDNPTVRDAVLRFAKRDGLTTGQSRTQFSLQGQQEVEAEKKTAAAPPKPSTAAIACQFNQAMEAKDYAKAKKIAEEDLNLEWTDFDQYPWEAQTAQKFLNAAKCAKATVSLGTTCNYDEPGHLQFNAAESAQILSACDPQAEVLKILGDKFDTPFIENPDEFKIEWSSQKYGWDYNSMYDNKEPKIDVNDSTQLTLNTQLANKIFGTKIPFNEGLAYTRKLDGSPPTTAADKANANYGVYHKVAHGNKMKSSTYMLEKLAADIVSGLQACHSTSSFGASPSLSQSNGMAGPFSVDASSYIPALNEVCNYSTPLVFDLTGAGLRIGKSGMASFDIDCDGQEEVISDLPANQALLVFDSKREGAGTKLTGAEVFGSKTDLTAYGIVDEDGDRLFYDDGFQPLRVLAAHFNLVTANKLHLDANDLRQLEDAVGLRLRVGGITKGRDRRFADLGITQVTLGDPKTTQHLEDAEVDMWKNRIMRQEGASFVIKGKTHEYADMWFNVQARQDEKVAA